MEVKQKKDSQMTSVQTGVLSTIYRDYGWEEIGHLATLASSSEKMPSQASNSLALAPTAAQGVAEADKKDNKKYQQFSSVGRLGEIFKRLSAELQCLPKDLRLEICQYVRDLGNIWCADTLLPSPFQGCQSISLTAIDAIKKSPLANLAERNFDMHLDYYFALALEGKSVAIYDAFSLIRSTFVNGTPVTKFSAIHVYRIESGSLFPALNAIYVCNLSELMKEWHSKESKLFRLISANDPDVDPVERRLHQVWLATCSDATQMNWINRAAKNRCYYAYIISAGLTKDLKRASVNWSLAEQYAKEDYHSITSGSMQGIPKSLIMKDLISIPLSNACAAIQGMSTLKFDGDSRFEALKKWKEFERVAIEKIASAETTYSDCIAAKCISSVEELTELKTKINSIIELLGTMYLETANGLKTIIEGAGLDEDPFDIQSYDKWDVEERLIDYCLNKISEYIQDNDSVVLKNPTSATPTPRFQDDQREQFLNLNSWLAAYKHVRSIIALKSVSISYVSRSFSPKLKAATAGSRTISPKKQIVASVAKAAASPKLMAKGAYYIISPKMMAANAAQRAISPIPSLSGAASIAHLPKPKPKRVFEFDQKGKAADSGKKNS